MHELKRYDDLLELAVFAMNCPYILDDVRKSKVRSFSRRSTNSKN